MAKGGKNTSRTTEKKGPAKGLSIDEILERKKPSVFTIRFLIDPEMRETENKARRRIGDAELAIARAERKDEEVSDELLEELAEAKDAHESIVDGLEFAEFRLVAIGAQTIEKLMEKHRPTITQQKEFQDELKRQDLPRGEKLLYDPDSFPPALLAACCQSPEMTVEQATKLWKSDSFNRGELGELFKAAWSVNQMVTA